MALLLRGAPLSAQTKFEHVGTAQLAKGWQLYPYGQLHWNKQVAVQAVFQRRWW
jgi:hypothetical protein